MTDATIELFNFYFRYKWNEVDFAALQEGMVRTLRASMAAAFGPALISGGEVAPSGGAMGAAVDPYRAISEEGYLHATDDAVFVTVGNGHATLARWDLIVARKTLTNTTPISRPNDPLDTVYLKTQQRSVPTVIAGTPNASPTYPTGSMQDDDVILCGVKVPATTTVLLTNMLDTSITPKLSDLSHFKEAFNRDSERYGDGADGDVTISAGTTNLTRDMYYRNLTITGGQIRVNGFRVFVSNELDITAAGGGGSVGIYGSGAQSASGTTPGAAGTPNTIGAGTAGGANMAAGEDAAPSNGGDGGAGGAAGGLGAPGFDGGGTSGNVLFNVPTIHTLFGGDLLKGGAGGGGGNDGDALGGAGGAGGNNVFVAAKRILVDSGGGSKVIGNIGGIASAGTGASGGGNVSAGGGGGGAGGFTFVMCDEIEGTTQVGALYSQGRSGGAGGTGTSGAAGGHGGDGGDGGIVTLIVLGQAVQHDGPTAGSIGGDPGGGGAGGAGGAGGLSQLDLAPTV